MLLTYVMERRLKFTWTRLDLNGFVSEGYSGQSTFAFQNDTIILHGGILNNFDPLEQKEYTIDPKICNRFQVINYNDLLSWKLTERTRNIITNGKPFNPKDEKKFQVTKYAYLNYIDKLIAEKNAYQLSKKKKKKKGEEEKKEKKDKNVEISNEIEDQKEFENDKIKINMCLNRLSHISFILRDEIDIGKDYLVIHGGETYGKILGDLQFYEIKSGKWINPKYNKTLKDTEIFPQVKGHAWTYFRYVDEDDKRKKKPMNNNKQNYNFNNKNNNNTSGNVTGTENILIKQTSEADRLKTKNTSLFLEYITSQKIKNKEYLISSLNNTVNNYLYNPTNIEVSDINKISEIIGINTNNVTTNKKTENLLINNLNKGQNQSNNNNNNDTFDNNFSLYQDDEEYYEKFVLLNGGMSIFHECKIPKMIGNKPVDRNNKQWQKLSSEDRLICDCKEEIISDYTYVYKRGKFTEVEIQKTALDESLNSETLRRFGHNLVFIPSLKLCFILFGFMKFKGFVFDLIQMNVKREPKNRIKTICELTKFDHIKDLIPGRMFASVSVYKEYLIVFGGVSDKRTFDDLWIINLDEKVEQENEEEEEIKFDNDSKAKNKLIAKISLRKVENEFIKFNPRYGCSTISYKSNLLDVNEKKVILFGGSVYYAAENKYEGLINEILCLKITVGFLFKF